MVVAPFFILFLCPGVAFSSFTYPGLPPSADGSPRCGDYLESNPAIFKIETQQRKYDISNDQTGMLYFSSLRPSVDGLRLRVKLLPKSRKGAKNAK